METFIGILLLIITIIFFIPAFILWVVGRLLEFIGMILQIPLRAILSIYM